MVLFCLLFILIIFQYDFVAYFFIIFSPRLGGGAHIIRAKVSRVRVGSIISRTVLGTPVFILPICVTGVKRFHSFDGYFTKINRC